MGQAPAAGQRSLRTVTRNFPGRSGEKEDQVYLCSPETAAASALNGVITDKLGMPYPRIEDPGGASAYDGLIEAPLPPSARPHALVKGPFHADLPDFGPIGDDAACIAQGWRQFVDRRNSSGRRQGAIPLEQPTRHDVDYLRAG
jgi:aconitate hydratase